MADHPDLGVLVEGLRASFKIVAESPMLLPKAMAALVAAGDGGAMGMGRWG